MPLAWIAVFLSAGIWITNIIRVPALFSAAAAVLLLAVSASLIGRKLASVISVMAAFFFIGCLLSAVSWELPRDHIRYFTPREPEDARITGIVIDEPYTAGTAFGEPRTGFTLKVRELQSGRMKAAVSGKARVSVTGCPEDGVSYGDTVSLQGRLSEPRGPGNPGEFDYAAYLARNRIFSVFSADADGIAVTARGSGNPAVSLAYRVRARIREVISADVSGNTADFLSAVLLGIRRGMDKGLNDDFMKTGTVHLLAISGLNVGLIAFLMLLVFGMLRIPRKAAACAAIALLAFYAVLTNGTPSVVRATVMSIAVLFGVIIGRDAPLWNSLGLAAIIILGFDPQAFFDIGFQLSFVSVASLLYIVPKAGPSGRKRNYIAEGCAVSLAAWAGTAPLVLKYFNIVTPVSVVSNLIAVPLSFAITAAAVPFILAAFLFPPLAKVFAAAAWFLCETLFRSNGLLAKVPFGHFYLPAPPAWATVAYYLFILAFINRRRLGIRAAALAAAALLCADIVIWTAALRPHDGLLRATFLDVGHGDAVFIEFPRGGNMLIDGGSCAQDWDAGTEVILPFLRSKGVQVIDAAVLTHPDADHVGGLASVFEGMPVRNIFESGAASGTPVYGDFGATADRKRIARHIIKRGDSISGMNGVGIECLNPAQGRAKEPGIAVNDKSVVLSVKFGKCTMLFCGDTGGETLSEAALCCPEASKARLIMLPHHGGKLSAQAGAFIAGMKPEFAVISQGRARREISASKSMLEAMSAEGVKAFSTNLGGAVFAVTDGDGLSVDNFESKRKISR